MILPEPCAFNEDYFERGPQTGRSLYSHYRWQPRRSIPMACRLLEMYPCKSILDFGCAKGYLVKALRIMLVEAWGYDISEYAIGKADDDTKPFLSNDLDGLPDVDVIFSKDTLEHVPKSKILETVSAIKRKCNEAFIIVPLGDSGVYRIEAYEDDPTHMIAEDESWWLSVFSAAGFKIESACYQVKGFKENWSHHPTGNGVFFLS